MTRFIPGILTAALTALAFAACDGAKPPTEPPSEPPSAEDVVAPNEPEAPEPETTAPPEETAAPVEADTSAGAVEEAPDTVEAVEALSPEEIAKFAVVVAEIDCTAEKFEDPAAHEKAVEAILTRAGLSRDDYDAQVMKYLDDATFKATRTQTLEMCKANLAAGPGEVDAGDSLRDKLLALTVAAECMRKQGATTEDMSNAMLALYKAHDIDLETYSREMAALANNQQFQAEIAAKTAACPEAPAAPDEADAGAIDNPGVVDEADAGVTDDPGAVDESDAVVAQEPDTSEPAPPPVRGVYKGLISPGGKLRITVNATGGIGASTATMDKQRYRLKGRYDKSSGAVHLGAKADRDFVQLRGRLDAKRGVIKGTWNGVVNGKRKSGNFKASR